MTLTSQIIQKIDNQATLGLLGTNNSLAYRVHEIEKHFHSPERWLGILGAQTATDWADDTLTPFVAARRSSSRAYARDTHDG